MAKLAALEESPRQNCTARAIFRRDGGGASVSEMASVRRSFFVLGTVAKRISRYIPRATSKNPSRRGDVSGEFSSVVSHILRKPHPGRHRLRTKIRHFRGRGRPGWHESERLGHRCNAWLSQYLVPQIPARIRIARGRLRCRLPGQTQPIESLGRTPSPRRYRRLMFGAGSVPGSPGRGRLPGPLRSCVGRPAASTRQVTWASTPSDGTPCDLEYWPHSPIRRLASWRRISARRRQSVQNSARVNIERLT